MLTSLVLSPDMRRLLFVGLLAGCTGVVSGGPVGSLGDVDAGAFTADGGTPGVDAGTTLQVTAFTCDPAQRPAELPLKRLSRVQYVNAVRDLVASLGLSTSDRDAVLTALAPDLASVPDDRLVGVPGEKHGGFGRLDQAIQQTTVDATYAVANHLGALLTATTARRTALLGACATNSSTTDDAACLTSFINKLGRLSLRRPVTTDELAMVTQVTVTVTQVAGATPVDAAALTDVIALLTLMPQFLYHVEEGDPLGAGPSALDAYALANRLSFHFWQTSPDAELRAAADSGALLTAEGYRAQVQRLFADPRTDAAVATFFAEWFRVAELTPVNAFNGTPVFDAFAGSDKPAADLHLEMQREVSDLAVWLARSGGTVTDVLTSNRHVAKRADLAKLYKAAPWDGVSAPVDLPEPERAGLLTRAAFLASVSGNTRPVMKGLRIRNAFLCQPIPPPPPTVMATPPPLSPDLTTREVVEHITQQPGTACFGCHSTLLNPLGFVTENFDALGRHRTTQALYDATGAVVAQKPVDTKVTPLVAGLVDPVNDAREVTAALAKSGEFHTCFAQQYFRYTFDRMEDVVADGCALRDLQAAALRGDHLADVLMSVALRDEFQKRDLR
jgi:hypothetical protein